MIDIEARLRRTFSSLAGNEALSDSLNEDSAAEMLRWGEGIAERFVRKTSDMDDDAADEFLLPYLRALRLLTRAMAKWTTETDEDVRLDWWNRIEQNARTLYGDHFILPGMNEFIAQIPKEASAAQAVALLRSLIDNGSRG
jgi:hypothetical protein